MTDLRTRIGAQPIDTPRRGALAATGLLAAPLACLLWALPLNGAAGLLGFSLFGLVAWVVQARIEAHHPRDRFGAANAITLGRAAGTSALAALAAAPQFLADGLAWATFTAAAALLALDGLDGWVARRQDLTSAFGARFDMEVDALAILVLSALALGLGKAGPWVLGLGLLRYGFVLAGLVWPALAAPLPPSVRRKAVCVLQLVVLTLLLAPPVTPPLSQGLAALAFAALIWSFAVDLRWLTRRAT